MTTIRPAEWALSQQAACRLFSRRNIVFRSNKPMRPRLRYVSKCYFHDRVVATMGNAFSLPVQPSSHKPMSFTYESSRKRLFCICIMHHYQPPTCRITAGLGGNPFSCVECLLLPTQGTDVQNHRAAVSLEIWNPPPPMNLREAVLGTDHGLQDPDEVAQLSGRPLLPLKMPSRPCITHPEKPRGYTCLDHLFPDLPLTTVHSTCFQFTWPSTDPPNFLQRSKAII